MEFLGFPDPFPDSRTIWLFKERMAETGKKDMVWAELQRQLDAMGLQVSLTSVSESLDGVETSSAERFRMPHSSKQIRVHLRRRNREARMPSLAAAEMAHGPRKETSPISATSYIRKPISITA
jgi:IS5 family transposase